MQQDLYSQQSTQESSCQEKLMQQQELQSQFQKPQLSRNRAQIQQNFDSSLFQQKHQFSNAPSSQQRFQEKDEKINVHGSELQQQEQQQQKKVITFEEMVNTKACEEATLDEDNNYENIFLGKEDAFSEFRILVGQFYNGFDFIRTAGQELKRVGFKFDLVKDMDTFSSLCLEYDILFVISDSQFIGNSDKFIDNIKQSMKMKKSLFIWADNTPYTAHANLIFSQCFGKMSVQGDYFGNQIITAGDKAQKSRFNADHSIAYGLNNLHEGITICHPINIHKDFEAFAYNSNNEPLVLTAEENEDHGRIILDNGFTKLFQEYYFTAGTHQYVSNCTVWLTGIIR